MQQHGRRSEVRLAFIVSLVARWRQAAIPPALGLLLAAVLLPLPGWAQTTRNCGSRSATFTYSETVDGTAYPSLSARQRDAFEQRFCDEVTRLEDFFAPATTARPGGKGWWQPAPTQAMRFLGRPDPYLALRGTFDGPFPDLRVSVSGDHEISKALLPAALGHRGVMQFPAREAVLNKAAIDHELTHVFFPNGNRLLAEGFAIYVQTLINSNPAFPNFGMPLNDMVRALFCKQILGNLANTDVITQFDKVSTPSELVFRVIGKDYNNSPLHTYAVAGSFVKFLIERNSGWDLFHQLYVLTPLIPLDRNEGETARYKSVYNLELSELESQWRAQFSTPPCPNP
jgi:hypothetical protein